MNERLQFYAMVQRLVLVAFAVFCFNQANAPSFFGGLFCMAAVFLIDTPRPRP